MPPCGLALLDFKELSALMRSDASRVCASPRTVARHPSPPDRRCTVAANPHSQRAQTEPLSWSLSRRSRGPASTGIPEILPFNARCYSMGCLPMLLRREMRPVSSVLHKIDDAEVFLLWCFSCRRGGWGLRACQNQPQKTAKIKERNGRWKGSADRAAARG